MFSGRQSRVAPFRDATFRDQYPTFAGLRDCGIGSAVAFFQSGLKASTVASSGTFGLNSRACQSDASRAGSFLSTPRTVHKTPKL